MANPRQPRNLIFGLSSGGATAALAIAFLLIVVASRPAQAQTYQVLHNFTGGQDGRDSYGGVTLDEAGNLYGTADGGGNNFNYGTVYRLKHKGSGWTFNPIYTFTGSDGANPHARVIFGPNGTLYGTTQKGGYGVGTVFNLRPQATACKAALCPWTETVLYSFTGASDGSTPAYADLLFDQAGNIYGATELGGSNQCGGYGCGVVYELTPKGSGYTESTLYAFSGNDGALPVNGVIFDKTGNLYGTTDQGGDLTCDAPYGCGTVFELMPSGGLPWTQCTLNNFHNSFDGAGPDAGLIIDPSGNLYGATADGGEYGGGTVFELTSSGKCNWTLKTLYSFPGTVGHGCGPRATLAMDGAGNLYGTTYCDGAYGYGSVFKLTPTPNPPWTYTPLYDFRGGNDGAHPLSTVVFDRSGNLYGTTEGGGAAGCDNGGCGVVWEITP